MYVKYKEILPVLFWICITSISRVSCSGWKPIPPPRGLYVSKVPHPIRGGPEHEHAFKHPLLDDFRIEALKGSLLETESEGLQEEDFHKHHNHKYNIDDIFSKPIDEPFFKKDPLKTFKPAVPSYEDISKRPPISFHNYNAFRPKKPGKTIYFEQPEEVKPIYKDEIKYIKQFKPTLYDEGKYQKIPSYTENEIKPYFPHKGHQDDHCTLYKVAFRQDLYFQYIQYKVHMPDLKEFTLCMWNKFHNHSNDHPLFSYAVRHQPKAIYMWVSNTERSNYYNMKVNGHTIFRLNYPIRLNKWYHTCQSWNGKTGEWQVWVNSERIGRGFHNLLVGHVIPGGGVAISGQEQRQLGGGFLEGPGAPKGSGGFLGEITMVQLYKVALTAGKAYTDHRHHHSLYAPTTEEPPPEPETPEPPPTPEHPFLENMQLKRPLKVFELAEALRTKGNLDTPENQPNFDSQPNFENQPNFDFFNNHFGHNYYGSIDSSALSSPFHQNHQDNAINLIPISDHTIYKRNDGNEKKTKRNGDKYQGNHGLNHKIEEEVTEKPGKVKFIVNPPAQVNVEKIKFPRKRNNEYEDEDYREDKNTRNKRQTNSTDIVMDDQFMGSFVTVDEGKTEPEGTEEEGRSGRALIIRRRPTRQNHQLSQIRRSPSNNRPKRISHHDHRFRPNGRKEDKITRKESDSSEEEPEKEKDKEKRQILLGDAAFGFPALSLVGSEYGPLFGPMPVLGIPLQPQPQPLPPSAPEFPSQEQPGENPLNTPEEEESGQAQPEPAENEVRRIMGVCSGCELDPFRKVAVISWRSTPKKIYSGALFLKARPECRRF